MVTSLLIAFVVLAVIIFIGMTLGARGKATNHYSNRRHNG